MTQAEVQSHDTKPEPPPVGEAQAQPAPRQSRGLLLESPVLIMSGQVGAGRRVPEGWSGAVFKQMPVILRCRSRSPARPACPFPPQAVEPSPSTSLMPYPVPLFHSAGRGGGAPPDGAAAASEQEAAGQPFAYPSWAYPRNYIAPSRNRQVWRLGTACGSWRQSRQYRRSRPPGCQLLVCAVLRAGCGARCGACANGGTTRGCAGSTTTLLVAGFICASLIVPTQPSVECCLTAPSRLLSVASLLPASLPPGPMLPSTCARSDRRAWPPPAGAPPPPLPPTTTHTHTHRPSPAATSGQATAREYGQ